MCYRCDWDGFVGNATGRMGTGEMNAGDGE
jgi:hypothetical protein